MKYKEHQIAKFKINDDVYKVIKRTNVNGRFIVVNHHSYSQDHYIYVHNRKVVEWSVFESDCLKKMFDDIYSNFIV